MKVAIVGAAGRMGQMLVKLAEADPELEISAKVDVAPGFDSTWPVGTEAIIDFTFHAAVPANIEKAAAEGAAYVIGTTGLTPEEQARVDACAAKIPVVQAANYSLGVNLLIDLVRQAAAVLGPQYDVEIVEMHHRHKKDAPSGTALMLAHAAADGRGVKLDDVACYGREGIVGERPEGQIALHALRGGSVVGDLPSCSRATWSAWRSRTRRRAARRSPPALSVPPSGPPDRSPASTRCATSSASPNN